jgi:hypothetical protein
MPQRLPPCQCLIALLAAFLSAVPLFGDAVRPSNWKFDVLRLKSGRTLQGMIVAKTSAGVRFQIVRQNAGDHTFVFNPTTFPHDEIASIVPLQADERDELAARLKKLDPNGNGERMRMTELELKPMPWGKNPKGGLCYQAEHFILESNAGEEIVRRVAVRLEEIYTAYSIRWPPRVKTALPTRVVLYQSLDEYRAMLRERGLNVFQHEAFFEASRNQIMCGSDSLSLGDSLAETRQLHDRWRRDARELAERYKKNKQKMPDSIRNDIDATLKRMARVDHENEKVFDVKTRRLFTTLYHEAFHAYLTCFVYPRGQEVAEVPRWLNEGLAQIFENGIVEAGDLRLGHPDVERLNRAKAALRGKTGLVPLADLLNSGPDQFLVHGSDRTLSDRYYLTSWALAFYLAFEKQLLGTVKLDEYLRLKKPAAYRVKAFETLAGQSLGQFEKSFHQYVLALQYDGTTSKIPVK